MTTRAIAFALPAVSLSLDRTGQAGDIMFDEERINNRDRNRAEQRPRHQLTPVEYVAANELGGHADRHRFLLGRGEEDQRVNELVPRKREREDPGREDPRNGDW